MRALQSIEKPTQLPASKLFRVFVHVYIHHFDRSSPGAEAHVNTCYKHFYYFVNEFHLINAKELEPLKEMTLRICPPPQPNVSSNSSIG
ncbi:MOB kinase activator 3A [Orchesella cincta]|uniref:MOB kinase activator 3A n=1 Tax=Orchesella cincta TaxID=48709 RepID=A0A1D2M191_ORCCI|nr:MOB kinase activator 3A [Orchesella cincta]